MPRRLRLNRRLPAAMSSDAYRSLAHVAVRPGITPDEALTFVFETFGSVTDTEVQDHRLRLFKAGSRSARREGRRGRS